MGLGGIMQKITLSLHFQEANCSEKNPSVWTQCFSADVPMSGTVKWACDDLQSAGRAVSMSFIESAFCVLRVEAGCF